MKCPFFEEIVVNFCSVAPIKKMIPKGKSKEFSRCEVDYLNCPMYQNWIARRKIDGRNSKDKKNDQ
ncbi:MAG: hypothetical protein ABIL46_03385 [candidate division WOR-3 bacterium]